MSAFYHYYSIGDNLKTFASPIVLEVPIPNQVEPSIGVLNGKGGGHVAEEGWLHNEQRTKLGRERSWHSGPQSPSIAHSG